MRYFIIPIVDGKNDDVDFRDYVEGFQIESYQRYIALKDTAKAHPDWVEITKAEYEAAKPIPSEPAEPTIELTTIEEQIYAENLYQTALLEMQMLGGI